MLKTYLNNKLFLGIGFLFFTLTLLFFIYSTTYAQTNLQAGEDIVLQKDQTVNKDYFATGDSVTISGTINGDAYIGAGKITVDGTINGDLIAAGGEVLVNGTVSQNLRVAGGNITVSGNIGRNATILGGNINLTNNSKITGSLVSAGGNLNLYSPIGKDLYLGAGTVTIGNNIGGDINAGVGNLTLNPDASISGNLNYISEQTAQIMNGASVSGQIKHSLPPQKKQQQAETIGKYAAGGFITFYKSTTFASLLVLGFIIIRLAPKFSLQTAKTFSANFWTSLVVGILTIVIIPVTFGLLLISVLGIPLAFILLFVMILTAFISKIFVSIWLGDLIRIKLNQNWNLYISFIAGLVTLTLLSFIPILGILTTLLVNIVGLGALLLTKKTFYSLHKKEF